MGELESRSFAAANDGDHEHHVPAPQDAFEGDESSELEPTEQLGDSHLFYEAAPVEPFRPEAATDSESSGAPDSSAARSDDPGDPVIEAIDRVAALIEDRERSEEAFHERLTAQEQLIFRMQQQVEELRADQVRSLLKPVLISLAKLHAEAFRSQAFDFDSLSSDRIASEFEFFGDRIVEAIEQLGFDSVGAAVGVEFDRTIHAAARAVDTDDITLDRRIARVARQGFAAPEDPKPLLYAQVDVYRYLEPTDTDPPAPLEDPLTAEPPAEGYQTQPDASIGPEGTQE